MIFKVPLLGIFFLSCLSNASVIPTIKVLQGPGSKTLLVGPDGSAVDSAAPGGTVVTDDHGTGLVAAGPAILPAGPELVVNGPAGSIVTSFSQAGPAVVPGVVPAAVVPVAVAPAVVAQISAVVNGAAPDDNGHEGAYASDNAEALYDDGSYKGEH